MSRLPPNQLSALKVSRHKSGDLCDGGGLWLVVTGGSRLWEFRFKSPITGKRRQMSLGSAYSLSLADAREKAAKCRGMTENRLDPIIEREKEKAARELEKGLTFAEVAAQYIKAQTPAWKDHRSPAVWTSSLTQHVFPIFGEKSVRDVDTQDVLTALRPIWTEKTETSGRIRGRIERILDYARVQQWREGENPARWCGHLSVMLPAPSKITKVQHHKAAEWKDISEIMKALQSINGMAAKAVRFCCLTAARSGEVRNAVWSEIDLSESLWVVPAEKMKAGREHRVPLSGDAVKVLQEVLPQRDAVAGDILFPGAKRGRPLSDVAVSKALHHAAGTKEVTVHGLRSTFRDWAGETKVCSREVAEAALAHAGKSKVEAAYFRSDLLDLRRPLMEAWAAQCRE